jgi:murein DD-endopeptidase MepM/ murein hydrolase activator NlpD
MRLRWYVLLFSGIGTAYAGFLQPVSFPKTVDDLSFTDRMALKTAGYEAFESEYDENGNCISGCAYSKPRLEDELEAMERRNALVKQDLVDNHNYTANQDGSVTPPHKPNAPVVPDAPGTPTSPPTATPPAPHPKTCTKYNANFGDNDIPYGNPMGNMACISSPYGPRKLEGKTSVHHGIDFRATIGTPVYAPANGTVAMVFVQNKTCGNGLVIEHSGGYSTKYCHFESVAVSKGEKLSSGCFIGKTGNTGHSTGPHLHYGVLKDGNPVNPVNFIEPSHKMCK